jgi:hypothetical protein
LVVVLSADPRRLPLIPGPEPPSEPLVHRILTKPATPAQLRSALLARAAAGVMDARSRMAAPPEMQGMFRQELALRLPGLENNLIRRELGLARAALHQMLASSRLCGDRRLETDLQALYTSCHDDADAAEIACHYYALLLDAGHFLVAPGTETTPYAPGRHKPGAPDSG